LLFALRQSLFQIPHDFLLRLIEAIHIGFVLGF
jgi:hypothetical protein